MNNPPNILFLFTDQHNAGVLGCEGHPDIRTPNLDSLAAGGTRFSRAYCQDAVCTPSRCSLFTGLYPRTLGCLENADRSSVMEEVVSLPTALKASGYATAAFGKRHLHQACDNGWDLKASHLVKESPDDNYVQWVMKRGWGEAFDWDWAAEWGRGAEGTAAEQREIPFAMMSVRESHLPEETTMEAWTKIRTVDFLKSRANSSQPFFCFSSFYRPHQPYTPLPRYYARFDRTRWGRGRNFGDGIFAPPSLRESVGALPPIFQELHSGSNRIWRLDLARSKDQIYRDYLAAYYALVEEIDDHVGDILRTLKESGLWENTLVIYASDHGDFVGAHGMVEKCASGHNIYEDTLRVPLIFHQPGTVRAGVISHGLAELVDIYPTLAELCDLRMPSLKHPLQGTSLAGTLRHGERVPRSMSVSENWFQTTVITDRFKLGKWTEPRRPESPDFRPFGDMLFDRLKDPLEIHNISGQPDYLEVEAQLRSHLEDWRERMETSASPHAIVPHALATGA